MSHEREGMGRYATKIRRAFRWGKSVVWDMVECRYRLLLGVAEYGRRLDIDSILFCFLKDGAGQLGFEIFGTISEIGLGGAHMGGVGHGVFTPFWQPVHAVGQNLAFFVG